MKFYANKRRVYRKRKTTAKKVYKKRGLTTAVKRYVKRTIHNNIENKTDLTLSNDNYISSYNQNSSLFVVSMIPYTALSQGTGQGGRLGNEIRTRKCLFKFVLYPSAYDVTLNPVPKPQEVMIFFGKVRNSKAQVPISTDFAKLWQEGDGQSAPTSNLLDVTRTINNDWFQVYKRLTYKIGYSIASTAGMAPSNEYFANNDFKLNVRGVIDVTKHCPKIVRFNDGTSQPTNDGLFMWAMCVPADGATATNPVPVRMSYSLEYQYEDA